MQQAIIDGMKEKAKDVVKDQIHQQESKFFADQVEKYGEKFSDLLKNFAYSFSGLRWSVDLNYLIL